MIIVFETAPPICLYAKSVQFLSAAKMVKYHWLIFVVYAYIHTVAALFFLFSCNITYWSCCCCWLTFLRYRYEVILTDNKNNNIRRLLVYVFFSLVVPAFSVLDAKINNNNNNISVSWCLEIVGTFQLLRFGSFKRVVIHVLCINLTYSLSSQSRENSISFNF